MKLVNKNEETVASSFRDQAGFVFKKDGEIYRQINSSYKKDYDFLLSSGLYNNLVEKKLIVSHEEMKGIAKERNCFKVIKPELIPFISYPYEWTFSQLKEVALCLLKIQKIAFNYGMTLKDASAYNFQFLNGQAVLIDSLSFEKYEANSPWIAYRQFCQHFLAPLALSSKLDIRFLQLSRLFIDGIPLDLASKSLSFKTKFNFFLLSHIHVHSRAQVNYSKKNINLTNKKTQVSKTSFLVLLDNLEKNIFKMKLKNFKSEWADYYSFTNYLEDSFKFKKEIILKFIQEVSPKTVWDLGSNDGEFARLASKQGILTYAFDIDYNALEKNYQRILQNKEKNLLPLFLDLKNPSPDLGWAHSERDSLETRGPADMVFALALVHHLAISNNLPFKQIAEYFSKLGKYLVIEFIPKEDSKLKKLLSSREDIFFNYNKESFEKEFAKFFIIKESHTIINSKRFIYLMKSKKH